MTDKIDPKSFDKIIECINTGHELVADIISRPPGLYYTEDYTCKKCGLSIRKETNPSTQKSIYSYYLNKESVTQELDRYNLLKDLKI